MNFEYVTFVCYFKILTKRLAKDTIMEVADIHVVVVVPISEFFALVSFGVT